MFTTSCDIGYSHNDIAKDPGLWVVKETVVHSLRQSTGNAQRDCCL